VSDDVKKKHDEIKSTITRWANDRDTLVAYMILTDVLLETVLGLPDEIRQLLLAVKQACLGSAMKRGLSSNNSEAELLLNFPQVPWREPLHVTVNGVGATPFGCRLCIAIRGLKGRDVGSLPQTREEFDKHMAERHAAQ
jgi:hypothetical protein